MAKDYAKVKSKKHRRRGRPPLNKGGNSSLWIIAMVLSGIFVAGLFFLKEQSARLSREKLTEKTVKQTISSASKPVDKTHQPRFDFYTMLPKTTAQDNNVEKQSVNNLQQVISKTKTSTQSSPNKIDSSVEKELQNEVAEQVLSEAKSKDHIIGNDKSSNDKTAIKKTDQIPFVYFLQLGIFKSFEAADQLKAQISLLGHEVQIKSIQRGELTLYRVVMGPYKTNDEAERNQQDLLNEHIRSEIVR